MADEATAYWRDLIERGDHFIHDKSAGAMRWPSRQFPLEQLVEAERACAHLPLQPSVVFEHLMALGYADDFAVVSTMQQCGFIRSRKPEYPLWVLPPALVACVACLVGGIWRNYSDVAIVVAGGASGFLALTAAAYLWISAQEPLPRRRGGSGDGGLGTPVMSTSTKRRPTHADIDGPRAAA